MSRKTKRIWLDNVPIRLIQPDLDGDGVTSGDEMLTQRMGDSGITPVIQPTELGESLKELNHDTIEPGTRMSGIDLRTRLTPVEISYVLAMDSLVQLGVLPTRCLALTRQKKRLSVSINGKGRDDIVNIVGGKKDRDERMGGGGFLKGMFGGNKNE